MNRADMSMTQYEKLWLAAFNHYLIAVLKYFYWLNRKIIVILDGKWDNDSY